MTTRRELEAMMKLLMKKAKAIPPMMTRTWLNIIGITTVSPRNF